MFFVWLIVVGILFGVLDAAGVVGKINDAYTTVQGGNAKAPVTAGIVFGGAAIIGVVNIVLFIALSTVGSVVYNLCADLVGGIEITLSERSDAQPVWRASSAPDMLTRRVCGPVAQTVRAHP